MGLRLPTSATVKFVATFQFSFLLARVRAARRIAACMRAMRGTDGNLPSVYTLKQLGNGARLHKPSDDSKLVRAQNDWKESQKELVIERAARRAAERSAACAEERADFTELDSRNAERRVKREEAGKKEKRRMDVARNKRDWWMRNRLLPGLKLKVASATFQSPVRMVSEQYCCAGRCRLNATKVSCRRTIACKSCEITSVR